MFECNFSGNKVSYNKRAIFLSYSLWLVAREMHLRVRVAEALRFNLHPEIPLQKTDSVIVSAATVIYEPEADTGVTNPGGKVRRSRANFSSRFHPVLQVNPWSEWLGEGKRVKTRFRRSTTTADMMMMRSDCGCGLCVCGGGGCSLPFATICGRRQQQRREEVEWQAAPGQDPHKGQAGE